MSKQDEISLSVLVEDRVNNVSLLVLIRAPESAIYGPGPVKLDVHALTNALEWHACRDEFLAHLDDEAIEHTHRGNPPE